MSIETFTFVATGQDSVISAFKSIDRAAQNTSRTVSRSVASETRARTQAANQAQRLAEKQSREAEKLAMKEARAKEKGLAYVARIRDRYFAQEQRAEERAAAKRERIALQSQRRLQAQRGKMIAGVGSMVGGAVGSLAMTAAALGVAGVGMAARDSISLGELANRVSITGRSAGQQAIDPAILKREFEAAALANPGIKSQDIGQGVATYVAKTGDLTAARQLEGTIATVASASGADTNDLFSTAAAFSEKFDVKGAQAMQQALATIAMQGKAGAVEIKDLAGVIDEISASAGAFNIGSGQEAVATLGGLAQIAKRGTGSVDEAATSLNNVFTQLQAKSQELAAGKYGGKVNVFDSAGKSRNIQDILVETIAGVGGGDLAKKKAGLIDVFGIRGMKAINPLTQKFEAAFNATKGTEEQKTAAGIRALRAELDKTINVAGGWDEIMKDAAQAQQDSSAKLTAAWEGVKVKVGEELVPKLIPLIAKLPEFVAALVPAITILGVFADVMTGVVEFLRRAGILNRETKADKAKTELSQLNQDLEKAGLNATPEMINRRKELENIIQGEASNAAQRKDFASENMTLDEATDRFFKLNPGSENAQSRGDIRNRLWNVQMGKDVDYNVMTAASDLALNPWADNITDAQKQFIRDFAESNKGRAADIASGKLGAGKIGGLITGKGGEIAELATQSQNSADAMKSFTTALTEATDNLRNFSNTRTLGDN